MLVYICIFQTLHTQKYKIKDIPTLKNSLKCPNYAIKNVSIRLITSSVIIITANK